MRGALPNSLFFSPMERVRNWRTVEDVDSESWTSWTCGASPHHPTHPDAENRILQYVREEIIRLNLCLPHLFVYTNPEGHALSFIGMDSGLENLDKMRITEGFSFAYGDSGLNAISLAMRTSDVSVVVGSDHSLDLFSHWSCICSPIVINGVLGGYFNLSLKSTEPLGLAVPLIIETTDKIVSRVTREDPRANQAAVMRTFEAYELTPREGLIGYEWLNNRRVSMIAQRFRITEQTVRTHLKRIYQKTGVSSRGEFMRKFEVS